MSNLLISGSITNKKKSLKNYMSFSLKLGIKVKGIADFFERTIIFTTDIEGNFIHKFPNEIPRFTLPKGKVTARINISFYPFIEGEDIIKLEADVAVKDGSKHNLFINEVNKIITNLSFDFDLGEYDLIKLSTYIDSGHISINEFSKVTSLKYEVVSVSNKISDFINPFDPSSYKSEIVLVANANDNISYSEAGKIIGINYITYCYLQKDTRHKKLFLRIKSRGPTHEGQVLVRSGIRDNELTFSESQDTFPFKKFVKYYVPIFGGNEDMIESSQVKKISSEIQIGDISAEFEGRIYESGIVLSDMDIDLEKDDGDSTNYHWRLRSGLHLGTGENFTIISLGKFDCSFLLTFKNYNEGAYDSNELDNLITVNIKKFNYDLLPGTDLDELPGWAKVSILGILGLPSTSGVLITTALLISALEKVITPVLKKKIEDNLINKFSTEVKNEINEEFKSGLNDAVKQYKSLRPTVTTQEIKEFKYNQESKFYFQGSSITIIDNNFVLVDGWAGASGSY